MHKKQSILAPVSPKDFSTTFNGNAAHFSSVDISAYYKNAIKQFEQFANGIYYWVIADLINGVIADAGGDLKKLCNCERTDMMGQPPNIWFSNYHPYDLPCTFAFANYIADYHRSISEARRQYLKISTYVRQLNNDQVYYWGLMQLVNILTDKNGNPCYSLNFITDVSHIKKDGVCFMSIYDSYEATCQHFFCTENTEVIAGKEKLPAVSKREAEILRYISKGSGSREIATKLNISIRTVNNHRENILKKLKVSSAPEAVSFAIRTGIL